MKIRRNMNKVVSRGRRYSPGERTQILEDAESLGVLAAANKHGCSKWTIYDWRKQDKRRAARAAAAVAAAETGATGFGENPTEAVGEAGPSQDASRQEERYKLILELWRQQPGLGPSQIRNQLKRKGFKAAVSTVRAIMEEHGYVQAKGKAQGAHRRVRGSTTVAAVSPGLRSLFRAPPEAMHAADD